MVLLDGKRKVDPMFIGPERQGHRGRQPSSATRAAARLKNDRGTNSLRPIAATASEMDGPSGEPSNTAVSFSSDRR